MVGRACEVCGGGPNTVVAASSYIPCSNAYCEDCWLNGLEPYQDLVALVFCCERIEDMTFGAQQMIDRTLEKLGKTREELQADADKMTQEYREEMHRD